MIRVVMVDDDPLVRTGLGMIIGGDPDIEVVGEAADGEQGLTVIADTAPDVVLLDLRMPVRDGLSVLAELAERKDSPAVVVLTTFNTDAHVLQALGDRAAGFLLKDSEPSAIIAGIHAAHRGEPVLSPEVASTVIGAATRQAPVDRAVVEQAATLTDREREVAVLMARGRTNAEIAETLYLSVATVKANLTRIFDKLAVDNRVSAAMAVRDAGLLDQAD